MNLVEICIAFLAVIVSVGTPLIFDVISKVDEKYHSKAISDLFENKSRKKLFQWLLIIATIWTLIYIGISIIQIHLDINQWSLVILLTSYLLIAFVSIVTGLFIHFTFIAIRFSRPSSLSRLIIEKNKKENFQKDKTMDAFFDFSLFPIRQKDFNFFYKNVIAHFSDIHTYISKKVDVSLRRNNYFEFGHKITKELASNKETDYNQFKSVTINNLWIIDKLDEKEYSWLWQNLKVAVENKEDEMVYYYWKRAIQYLEYKLRIPDPIYKKAGSVEKINQIKIDKIELARKEFIDFHYYLGGLLLYGNRIDCIRRIWEHTNSQPPRYPLLPDTMNAIFKRYFDYSTVYDQQLWEKAAQFNFPQNDGINFDGTVNGWIRKYLILLFLRQYTLVKYYTFQDFISLPTSPDTQAEIKHWLDNIDYFKQTLEVILADQNLLKNLRLDVITDKWCEQNNKTKPLDFVDQLKQQIEKDFAKKDVSQEISSEKEKQFWECSRKTIENAINEYQKVSNNGKSNSPEQYRNPFYISGSCIIALKSDFADEQAYDHLNYHSFLAEQLADNFRMNVSETFQIVATQGYRLKEEDVFPGINRLIPEKERENFIIVSFKNNIKYFLKALNVERLKETSYYETTLVDIQNCNGHIVGNTFFVLRKKDLPYLNFKEPVTEWKYEKNEGDNIIPGKNISAFIIDLHKNSKVSTQLKEKGKEQEFENKVLVCIEMLAEILWKKEAKVVVINVTTAYENNGIPNELEEIKPFEEI